MPKSNKADENEPRIKYLSPASVEKEEFFFDAAKTYKHKLCSSIDRYNEIISYELTKNIKPRTAHKINIRYSKLLICCFRREFSEIIKQKNVVISKICLTFKVSQSKMNVF